MLRRFCRIPQDAAPHRNAYRIRSQRTITGGGTALYGLRPCWAWKYRPV